MKLIINLYKSAFNYFYQQGINFLEKPFKFDLNKKFKTLRLTSKDTSKEALKKCVKDQP